MKDIIKYNDKEYELSTVYLDDYEMFETMIFQIRNNMICGNEVYCFRTVEAGELKNKHGDIYFHPENNEDYSDEIPKEVLEKLVELACKQIEIDYEEVTIEEMIRKFIERNGEELFRNFANTIVGMMHSDKWSVTYDWIHDNFTFLEGENDGQIITKFVELVKNNRL